MSTLKQQLEPGGKLGHIYWETGVVGTVVTLLCIVSLIGIAAYVLPKVAMTSQWVNKFVCHTQYRMDVKSCLLEDAISLQDQTDFSYDDIPPLRALTSTRRNSQAWLGLSRKHQPVFLTDYWVDLVSGFAEPIFSPVGDRSSVPEFLTRANTPWWLIHLPFYNHT